MDYLPNYLVKKSFIKIILLGITVFLIFCNSNQSKKGITDGLRSQSAEIIGFSLKYDLNKPLKQIDLPIELQEISGLSYYQDQQLVCHQDEKADIFIIDYMNGNIVKKLKSDKMGDYEGIEYVNNKVYLLKSNGTITEYSNFNTTEQKKKSYKTKISQKNDAEGLAFDFKTNSLLVACKNKPSLKDAENKLKHKRCIYQFNLESKELTEEPYLCIDLKKLEKKFGKKHFMPSAIAYCPVDENFYVLSAVGNLMLVIKRNGRILHLEKLPPSQYAQPEGICFSPDGKYLFISNEGKLSKPNILVFERQTTN